MSVCVAAFFASTSTSKRLRVRVGFSSRQRTWLLWRRGAPLGAPAASSGLLLRECQALTRRDAVQIESILALMRMLRDWGRASSATAGTLAAGMGRAAAVAAAAPRPRLASDAANAEADAKAAELAAEAVDRRVPSAAKATITQLLRAALRRRRPELNGRVPEHDGMHLCDGVVNAAVDAGLLGLLLAPGGPKRLGARR